MKKKVFTAAGFIVALIVIALVVDACGSLTSTTLRRDVAIVTEDASERASTDVADAPAPTGKTPANAEVFLDALSKNKLEAFGFSDQLPESFSGEVFSGEGFDEVLVAEDGAVVGFVGRGSSAEVFSQLSDELVSKGWLPIESEQKTMGTFVKKYGTYTWLMLACSGVDEKVSVVIQVRKAS